MALPPIPLNNSCSSSLTLSCSSSLHFLLCQPQTFLACSIKTIKFRVSCSNQTVQADTQQPQGVKVALGGRKKKRKPRPSFFEQIKDKWSLDLGSQRQKFPWQEAEQVEQPEEQEEEEEQVEECNQKSPRTYSSDTDVGVKASVNQTVSLRFQKRYSPWAVKPVERQYSFEPKDNGGELLVDDNALVSQHKNNITSPVIESVEIEEDVTAYDKTDREFDGNDDITAGIVGRGEKRIHLNIKPISEGEDYDEFSTFTVEYGDTGNLPGQRLKGLEIEGDVRGNSSVGEVIAEDVGSRDTASSREEKGVYLNIKPTGEGEDYGKFSTFTVKNGDTGNLPWQRVKGLEIEEDVRGNSSGDKIAAGDVGSRDTASSREEKGVYLNIRPTGDGEDYGKFSTFTVENGSIRNLPWQRVKEVEPHDGDERRRRRSNTDLAEKLLPEHELQRLRNIALRMMERFRVGVAGVTQELVDSIHEKWKLDEVVKLKFEGPLAANMKRAHEMLESKTGGLVVWRSGSSVVLYRGLTYKFPCVQSYANKFDTVHHQMDMGTDASLRVKEPVRTTEPLIPGAAEYLKDLSEEELMELSDLNHLLDELGPRFKDWSGREPLPVDADLLPAVVPGYKTPFRLLPYGVRHGLKNKEMTDFRRLARRSPPHFALGRNRELQGLARAMVKLWEKSAIAKIAIKRGVENTCNERMTEELKKLTGGTLLSRNKEYIVFYRGNDFLPPAVTEALTEREKLNLLQHDEEEQARKIASSVTESSIKTSQVPLLAGTLAETKAATSHWGRQPSRQEVKEMMRDSALSRLTSLIRNLEKKLVLAKAKVKKAERALAKLMDDMEPSNLPTDLETLTNEERFLFRKIGLSMKPYLLLGVRGVYSGTIENMHLHWKYRELVKIIVKRKNFAQLKHIAISLEAESGGVLVSIDKTTHGHAIIVYRGKNYLKPPALKPENLLTRRQALARSIELQRREALKHHISDLEELIELLKSELEYMRNGKNIDGNEAMYSTLGDSDFSDDDSEEDEET
ncbi:hypothetical protein L6164_011740 [Bauhinia variegata]|uniref:Uncharacterized protein n=1 Tax=Bauhinia variegata TaxID=167791 RepID=A0ACB9P7R2_BAUVA|nr:hypothetical protein L6164_011740 [Bauhinia variegata]